MDADGFVTIIDRTEDMLVSGGENAHPAEIEHVLLGHPAITDAAIGGPSARWGGSPLAIVVVSNDDVSAEDVLAHTRGSLAPFKTVEKDGDPPRSERQDPRARTPRTLPRTHRLNLTPRADTHPTTRPSVPGHRVPRPTSRGRARGWVR